MSEKLTQARLKDVIDYDPITGAITWSIRSCNRWPDIGRVAGTLSVEGYRVITLGGVMFKAHHLAWLHTTGELPVDQIDHIDGNRDNNSIKNLRECSHAENHQNRKDPERRHPGLRGAYRYGVSGRWRSVIVVDRSSRHLGYFNTPEDAHQAYLTAKAQLHKFNPIPRP